MTSATVVLASEQTAQFTLEEAISTGGPVKTFPSTQTLLAGQLPVYLYPYLPAFLLTVCFMLWQSFAVCSLFAVMPYARAEKSTIAPT